MQLFVRLNDHEHVVNACPRSDSKEVISLLCATSNPGPSYEGLVVRHNGRSLETSLEEAGVKPWDVLEILPRLLGGGGDGGATGAESRSCYLEMYLGRKPDKVNPEEERLARWTTCHLSGEPLSRPIVADELGNLFNKEALLQALLSKSLPTGLKHIQGLKHVVELKLEEAGSKGGSAHFVCPVTGLDFNGKARFLIHFKTGLVVSERGWKEVPKVVEELAASPCTPESWIPVNPTGEEAAALVSALAARREAQRASKKEKRAVGVAASNGGTGETAAEPGSKRAGPPTATLPAALAPKKSKVSELAPANANKKIWNSIFTHASGLGPAADGYMLRGTASRGMKMA
ncbi:hypothetical protein ACKKBF_B38560 [Auxenochlorella protothecoides x Auxenochlorella symbiontica]